MIAVRSGALVVAVLMTLAALRATDSDLQPSALRLMVSCVIALLTPLFWPGAAETRKGSALRILGWSLAATGLAAFTLGALGTARQSVPSVFEACAMLFLVLLVVNTATALVEARWLGDSATNPSSRELAGRTVALALALFATLPFWLGPAAEALSSRHAWAIDATLSLSPIVHLAVASGNDLMRNEWFYQHLNVASLQFEYPGLPAIALSYSMVLLALGLLVVAYPRRRSPVRGTPGAA